MEKRAEHVRGQKKHTTLHFTQSQTNFYIYFIESSIIKQICFFSINPLEGGKKNNPENV
uniref:Uncharacterized protein n=1 Tax=Anguilla anguilla TaxID=7936 RepID=A0A0E9XKX4_ANGAN